jgi:putative Holliday junction resolvase
VKKVFGKLVHKNNMNKSLGIDYGIKRVGVATSDESGILAFPKIVLPNDKFLLGSIKKIIEEEEINTVVLGESLDYKNKPNPIMEKILIFKKELEKRFDIVVHLEPEFLSSVQAEVIQGKNKKLDASAAAIILQSYLDKLNN